MPRKWIGYDPQNRKHLNNLIDYDGHMISRYVEDLRRRHPRAYEVVCVGIVSTILIFAGIGCMTVLYWLFD